MLFALDGISTHTLRKEGDDFHADNVLYNRLISTHTLRKEGDSCLFGFDIDGIDFNPHPPQGG